MNEKENGTCNEMHDVARMPFGRSEGFRITTGLSEAQPIRICDAEDIERLLHQIACPDGTSPISMLDDVYRDTDPLFIGDPYADSTPSAHWRFTIPCRSGAIDLFFYMDDCRNDYFLQPFQPTPFITTTP